METQVGPVIYKKNFLSQIRREAMFSSLWHELEWLNVAGPRLEYYHHVAGNDYGYGSGAGFRVYKSQKITDTLEGLWIWTSAETETNYDAVFLNGYRDGNDHLGWHSDDSPEMDDSRGIAIVTLGEPREIWFRQRADSVHTQTPKVEKLLLESGSLCFMPPYMQDRWQHRIPKAGRICGPRVSLTFRGTV